MAFAPRRRERASPLARDADDDDDGRSPKRYRSDDDEKKRERGAEEHKKESHEEQDPIGLRGQMTEEDLKKELDLQHPNTHTSWEITEPTPSLQVARDMMLKYALVDEEEEAKERIHMYAIPSPSSSSYSSSAAADGDDDDDDDDEGGEQAQSSDILTRTRTAYRASMANAPRVADSAGHARWKKALALIGVFESRIRFPEGPARFDAQQRRFIKLFLQASACWIYGEDWNNERAAHLARVGLHTYNRCQLVIAPRRFGKTIAMCVAIAIVMLVCGPIEIRVFAQKAEMAEIIKSNVANYVRLIDTTRSARDVRAHLVLCLEEDRDRLTKTEKQRLAMGHRAQLTALPDTEKGDVFLSPLSLAFVSRNRFFSIERLKLVSIQHYRHTHVQQHGHYGHQ